MANGIRIAVLVLAVSTVVACKSSTESKDCPVVGNRQTHIYHVPGDRNYDQMLQENTSKKDNRACFKSVEEAEAAGYRKSKSGGKKWWEFFK